MGQEFVINSTSLEDKINSLLPSQGGAGAGVDLSASTTIVPIIDLTESAEGSSLRQDLQTSFSLTSITAFDVRNTTTTILNTTGYFRIFGICSIFGSGTSDISITDGTTTKEIIDIQGSSEKSQTLLDFIVLLQAGDSVTITSGSNDVQYRGNTRQLAAIDGTLVNP